MFWLRIALAELHKPNKPFAVSARIVSDLRSKAFLLVHCPVYLERFLSVQLA
jgi:hypothetical protein